VNPNLLLEPVLEIADSVMTYRRRYYAEARLANILHLLVAEPSNPRSLAFQLNALREHFGALSGNLAPAEPDPGAQGVEMLFGTVSGMDWETLTADWPRLQPSELLQSLDSWGQELTTLSEHLTGRYLSHTVPRIS
jgi:uncharacterized alpha-E superfamily protein